MKEEIARLRRVLNEADPEMWHYHLLTHWIDYSSIAPIGRAILEDHSFDLWEATRYLGVLYGYGRGFEMWKERWEEFRVGHLLFLKVLDCQRHLVCAGVRAGW
jgi:hypothetical protein